MEDGEVDDGDDDLHDGDEGGDEHRAPLLDAPCQQHERHAAADHAGVEDGEDLELAGDGPGGEAAAGDEADGGDLEEAER